VSRAGFGLVLALGAAFLCAGSPALTQSGILRDRLPNGVIVLVKENPATPVVAVSLFIRAGSRWEGDDHAGVTHLLQQLLLKGTRSRSALDIADTAERIGGGLGASADSDFSEIRGTALARHWTRLLELIAELARLISFSFRLFGNMLAGEILLLVMTFLLPVAFIAVLPFYALELFVGFIQALVFAMLTLVFAVMAVSHHGEAAEEHAEVEADTNSHH